MNSVDRVKVNHMLLSYDLLLESGHHRIK